MNAADPRFAPVARVLRGGHAESWHLGAVAVVTPEGRLVARVGDAAVTTCLRSAAKPFQALPLVLSGAADRYGFEVADLALTCASHGGTPGHTERAAALLARGGFTVAELQCGAHEPMDAATAAALRERREPPSALHNNCSGKHAGMLLACRHLALDPAGYLAAEHPYQRQLRAQVARFAAIREEDIALGIDGCSVPAFFLSIAQTARAYAALADPRAAGFGGAEAVAVERIADAMTGAPEMVAGPGRFTTRLMEVTGGRILGKEGAEAFFALAVRGPVALGIAVKIADGGERGRDGVVLDVLRQMGVLSAAELAELAPFHRPLLHNHRGLLVGEVQSVVELEDVDAPTA